MDTTTAPKDDIFTRLFRHSRQYRIITCVECRTAIVPGHAIAYLARNHSWITKEERRRVQRHVDSLGDLARSVLDVRFPGPDNPPYGEIPVKYGGLRCLAVGEDGRRCRYVVSTTRMIRAHCEAAHGWRNEQKRGGNVKQKKAQPPNRIWDEGHIYQQFFNEPSWKRNTPVTIPGGDGGTTVRDAVELFDRLLTQRETEDNQQRQRQTI
jgi:hypothetical protein